jgi:signal transduction histidine kinase
MDGGPAVLLTQALRCGAIALPLLALAPAATAGLLIDPATCRHAGDTPAGSVRQPAVPQAGGEPYCRMAPYSAHTLALRRLETELPRHAAFAWPTRQGQAADRLPSADAPPAAGRDAGDAWPVATGAALLMLMLLLIHQRNAIDRLQRQHTQALRSQRLRLEAEVSRCTRDLSELARHLHTVHEDESRRLAHDLHDELGALLTVAKLNTARLKRSMGPAGADTRLRLEQLEQSLNEGMALKQRIIENLMPSSLTHLGLAPALEILTREFAQRAGLPVRAHLVPLRLAGNADITVYRLVQECLTNIARHAEARHVHITLNRLETDAGPCARIRVSDDGRGFEPALARCSGHGLLGMRYRVEAAGGTWQLRSSPGRGTRVEAHLPLSPECRAACVEPQ